MTSSISATNRHLTVQTLVSQKTSKSVSLMHDRGPLSLPCDRLLTPDDVARVLRIGRTRVYALLNTEALRSLKIGKLRRIRLDDLEAFIAGATHQHNGRCPHEDFPRE
jgi:excisionase family DNA binding protein